MSRAQCLEVELANRLYAALGQINQAIAGATLEQRGTYRELGLRAAAADISFALNHFAGDEARVREATERKHAEAIAEGELRFASGLIEAMPGIFYLYDEHGRFLRWNSNFEKVSGYTAQEIASMHPLDFFTPSEKALVEERIGEVFAKGEATVEASLVSKQGSVTPYFFTGKRIELDGAVRLVGVGVDIAERKRAEDALKKTEERYRSTLDTILEGCQLIGFDWRYLYLNPAAALQNRRANAELMGRKMPEAWPGIEASDVFALLRRCMDERIGVRSEIEFGFGDGHTGWFDVRAQPVPEGIFVLSVDISERRRAEQALRELNESLELKVLERTRDLDAAKERAEAADRVKSAFLATMSHELRTPLNSILGFTGIVLKGMAGPLTSEQHKQLGMVQGSARHLLDLINDVLDISKIEAGQLEIRSLPLDLRASIARVTGSVLPLAEKKGLSLRVVEPSSLPSMLSDQRRVEQILLNLLNNAIKFTERGQVTLTVELVDDFDPSGAGQAARAVCLRVSDTGIGMRQEDLSSLFQPFRQIDSGLQRQHEGTGLGLAICRRLTGLLGGTIRAESTLGQGSAFTAVLPLERRVHS
ncbi:MAG: ATP-binding protein [Pseudomonadota bacterium]